MTAPTNWTDTHGEPMNEVDAAKLNSMGAVVNGKGTYTKPVGGIPAADLATDSVTNAKVAPDAIGLTELDTTGTPDSTKALFGDMAWKVPSGGGGGTGDVVGPSSAADSEVALFSGTTGKIVKRATINGIPKLTSGVISAAAAGTDYVLPGGALGTPTSGNLANCTNLPLTAVAPSTSTAFGAGSINLGHASDTTVTRISAGEIAIEGGQILKAANAVTVTQKRVTPRVLSLSNPGATPTINTDLYDAVVITGQTVDFTSMTTNLSGTPTEFQPLEFAITGTGGRAIPWGAGFEDGAVDLPTSTVGTDRLDVGFRFNTATSKFRCVYAGSGAVAPPVAVTSPVFAAVGTALAAGTLNSAAVPVPAGVTGAVDEAVIVVIYKESTTTVTAPTGFVEAASSPWTVTGAGAHVGHVFYKRPTGADTGTYSFTFGATIFRSAVALRYTGCVSSAVQPNPFDVTTSAIKTTTADTTIPAVSVTTSAADQRLVWVGTNFSGGSLTTPPTGFTERAELSTAGMDVADKSHTTAGTSGSLTGATTTNSATGAWLGSLSPVTSPGSGGGGTEDLLFNGDYSTGDFSQWEFVQTKNYNADASGYTSHTYPLTLIDESGTDVARFEVRSGDFVSPGDRSEVSGRNVTNNYPGETHWFAFSTKFDAAFPTNHASLGWGNTNQWHPNGGSGKSPIAWQTGRSNGNWSLVVCRQDASFNELFNDSIIHIPLDRGNWHDIVMHICWSYSDTVGFIELWRNGVKQTFVNGTQKYMTRTMIPNDPLTYYKEGYYRMANIATTGIVYHKGFHKALNEADL